MIVKGGQICIGNRRQSALQCNGKESSRQTVHLSDTLTSQTGHLLLHEELSAKFLAFM